MKPTKIEVLQEMESMTGGKILENLIYSVEGSLYQRFGRCVKRQDGKSWVLYVANIEQGGSSLSEKGRLQIPPRTQEEISFYEMGYEHKRSEES